MSCPNFSCDTGPPHCPVCGNECEIIYKSCGEIVGCDVCLERFSAAWEPECYLTREILTTKDGR